MRILLLYLSAVVLLSSCAGRNFLQQKYTHYGLSPSKSDLSLVAAHDVVKKMEKPMHMKKSGITAFNPSKADTVLKPMPTTIFPKVRSIKPIAAFAPQQKEKKANGSTIKREQAGVAHTSTGPDPFRFIAIVIWVLVVLFLLALLMALIGLIVLLASHVILGVTLLAVGIIGAILWLIAWG
jgi:hypothetical protein